jgi:hypothetical protein
MHLAKQFGRRDMLAGMAVGIPALAQKFQDGDPLGPPVRWPDINRTTMRHLTETREAIKNLHGKLLVRSATAAGFRAAAKPVRAAFAALDGVGITDALLKRLESVEDRDFLIADIHELHGKLGLKDMGMTEDELEDLLVKSEPFERRAGFAKLKQHEPDGTATLRTVQESFVESLEAIGRDDRASIVPHIQTAEWDWPRFRRDACWSLDQSSYVFGALAGFSAFIPGVDLVSVGFFAGVGVLAGYVYHNAC